jgi:hypothetical protein
VPMVGDAGAWSDYANNLVPLLKLGPGVLVS